MAEYFLFPFHKVRKGSRIVIYGAGRAGQILLDQVLKTQYCEVICLVDKSWSRCPKLSRPVLGPEYLEGGESYDFLVISVQLPDLQEEITAELTGKWQVPAEKVVAQELRMHTEVLPPKPEQLSVSACPAFERPGIPIAFVSGDGLGDSVIMRKLYDAVLQLAPDGLVDFFSKDSHREQIETFFGDSKKLNAIHPVSALNSCCEQYALVLSNIRWVKIEFMNKQALSAAPALLKAMEQIERFNSLYQRGWHNVILRNNALSHIMGWNHYTTLGGGALPIYDRNVEIKLYPEAGVMFRALGLGRYMTVGSGSGGDKGRRQVKEWPAAYMERYIELVKQAYPQLQIVQLGASGVKAYDKADRSILGEKLKLVEHILAHSLLHVDIEGGLVHIASQLGTKCAVIFGPTPMQYCSYPQNINICVEACYPCYGAFVDMYHCLRGFDDKPPCMYGVTPELVWSKTREYLAGHDGI